MTARTRHWKCFLATDSVLREWKFCYQSCTVYQRRCTRDNGNQVICFKDPAHFVLGRIRKDCRPCGRVFSPNDSLNENIECWRNTSRYEVQIHFFFRRPINFWQSRTQMQWTLYIIRHLKNTSITTGHDECLLCQPVFYYQGKMTDLSLRISHPWIVTSESATMIQMYIFPTRGFIRNRLYSSPSTCAIFFYWN